MQEKQKIWIDTDPGDDIDDLLALAFALLRSELDVLGITTVTAFADKRAALVRTLLRTLNKQHIPVGAGMQLPMREIDSSEYNRMTDNGGYVMNHGAAADPLTEPAESAIELLVQSVHANPGEIGLVTLGPLTNIAAAMRYDPSIAKKLKWIAVMGGEVVVYRREHNISWDDHAADIVFRSGVPMFVGTWSVTRRIVVTEELCVRIREHGSEWCRFLSECIRLWWPYKLQKPGPVLFDIAPIVWSFNRSLYKTTPMALHVETKGEYTRGVTVPVADAPANAEVTIDVDEAAVLNMFMETLCPR